MVHFRTHFYLLYTIFYKRKCITTKVEDTLLTTVHSFMTLI